MIQLNRHCPAILMRKLRRWFEPDLDQQRVARTFEWAIPVNPGVRPLSC